MISAENNQRVDPDDTHTTLGRRFRTPSHPDVLMALGHAQYTFLSLEESVTVILYEAGVMSLPEARGKLAGAKEGELRRLANRYRQHADGQPVAGLLDAAAEAFQQARELVRNKLSHAHPYTAGTDAEGNYLPGLGYTVRDGSSWETLSATPDDLLDMATEVERAIDPLSDARMAVRERPLAKLS